MPATVSAAVNLDFAGNQRCIVGNGLRWRRQHRWRFQQRARFAAACPVFTAGSFCQHVPGTFVRGDRVGIAPKFDIASRQQRPAIAVVGVFSRKRFASRSVIASGRRRSALAPAFPPPAGGALPDYA